MLNCLVNTLSEQCLALISENKTFDGVPSMAYTWPSVIVVEMYKEIYNKMSKLRFSMELH